MKYIWNYLSIASHELQMMYCRISYQIYMYLARSSNELRLNRIWIIAWCFQVHFTCITYVNHMNYVWFISISYHAYMEFTWSCREVYDKFVQEDTCVNFIWTSYETIFVIFSNELNMQLIWKTVEFYIRIWQWLRNACEIHTKSLMSWQLAFDDLLMFWIDFDQGITAA